MDPLVPFEGGAVKSSTGGAVISHAAVLKLWVAADHCDNKPVVTQLPDIAHDGTSIVKEEYSDPATGIKVIGYRVTNGGHSWPGGTQYLPKFLVGSVSHNMNACQVIWDFFKSFSSK